MPLWGRRNSKPEPGALIDWSQPLSQGLGVCLAFAEGGGGTLYDACGGPAMPVTGSTAWTAGRYGMALQGTGTNQYGDANYPAINGWKSLTVAALWMCPPGTTSSGRIVEKGANNEWVLDCETGSNKLSAIFYGGPKTTLTFATAVFDGGWHHIAATRDFSTGAVVLYVDGAAVVNSTQTGIVAGGSADLHLWQYALGLGSFSTKSALSGLWVANRAWSAAEVSSHAAAPWQMFGSPRGYSLMRPSAAPATRVRRTLSDRAGSRGVA